MTQVVAAGLGVALARRIVGSVSACRKLGQRNGADGDLVWQQPRRYDTGSMTTDVSK